MAKGIHMTDETNRADWADEKHRRIIEEQRRFLWTPAQLERLAAWIGLRPGMTLADVGCGYGYIGRTYLPYISPGGRVVGVDIEAPLVEEAQRRAAAEGVGDRCTFLTGDACHLPLPAASADVAYCQTLLMHLATPEECLAELVRVTKPGGVVVCNEPDHRAAGGGYNSALPYEREEFLEDLVAGLISMDGHKGRGRGDYAVGSRVPEMMHKLGLVDIDARFNEKVPLLVPPYDTPEQEHMKSLVMDSLKRREEWREEGLADYLAGGGKREDYERYWERWGRRSREVAAALEAGTLFMTGGRTFYVIRGRKPA
jgi:SAM-dependent methyltransferase